MPNNEEYLTHLPGTASFIKVANYSNNNNDIFMEKQAIIGAVAKGLWWGGKGLMKGLGMLGKPSAAIIGKSKGLKRVGMAAMGVGIGSAFLPGKKNNVKADDINTIAGGADVASGADVAGVDTGGESTNGVDTSGSNVNGVDTGGESMNDTGTENNPGMQDTTDALQHVSTTMESNAPKKPKNFLNEDEMNNMTPMRAFWKSLGMGGRAAATGAGHGSWFGGMGALTGGAAGAGKNVYDQMSGNKTVFDDQFNQ